MKTIQEKNGEVEYVLTSEEYQRLHEANQAMLDALKKARAEFAGLPRSLGYEFDHIKAIDAAIAKGEAK